LFTGLLRGDDEGKVVLGVAGLLQYRFEPNVLAGENPCEFRDNAGPIVDAESQVVRAMLQRHRHRLILAEALVRKRRDAPGPAAANFAGAAHQTPDPPDPGRWSPPPTKEEGALAEHALSPPRVIRTLHARQNRRRRNQRGTHEKDQPLRRLASAT